MRAPCSYVQLCSEDYRWWWRSYHRGGAIAAYVLLFALYFLFSKLPAMHGLSIVLYVAYMSIVVLGTHLAFGAVGFASSFWFVYSIFAAVKSD
jgi:transmembrane 9 superfamily member 2/4